jgi:AcrR family transcriptional regulator
MAAVTTTARARARAEITTEIKAAARRQVAESGAASLSLRAVARELGMVSSNVYRYFASRDDLLTALIIDAYDAIGSAAEEEAAVGRRTFEQRWIGLARAIRGWALDHPHDYALVYGSPVPGYRAPTDTVSPATRVTLVALRLLADAVRSGEIRADAVVPMPRPLHADLAGIRAGGLASANLSDEVLARGLQAWTQLFGTISFEMFGHLQNVIHDYDAFFDHQMRRAARTIAGREGT